MTAQIVYNHWIDALVEEILNYWGSGVKTIYCSCGLSVSGLQHVGRLRGEVTLANTVMHLLHQNEVKTRHTIVRYTSDEWKGKPEQLSQFPNPEKAKEYIGFRLVDVPDPRGEFASWIDRYWLDFGNYLDQFSRDAQVLSTHEIYMRPEMKELVRYAIEHRDLVREVVNRYRTRAPHPPEWIPIDVVCEKCQRINTTTVTAVDLDAYTAEYRCDHCDRTGSTSIVNGKLSWRVEWAALWKALEVGFEPFGKDHATPGGSRDSAKEIAESVFKFKPPVPFAYEWVGLIEGSVDKGDMGSSDFLGFTPQAYISVASGESLRYLFLKNKPMRRITLGLEYVPTYVGQYDRAERLYFNIDTSKAPAEELADIRRSYELSQLDPLPDKPPLQVPYLHAVVLAQILPEETPIDVAIEKLAKSELIPQQLTSHERQYITTRIKHAKTWVTYYAPDSYRIQLLEQPPPELNQQIPSKLRSLYQHLHKQLSSDNWAENKIRDTMKAITQPLRKDKSLQQAFFRFLYQAFFARDDGPRISAFFAFTDSQLVLDRLQYLATPP